MKSIEGSWSTVLVGKWNKYLLTPDWVGTHIFEADPIEVLFPVNRPDAPPQYKSNKGITFTPSTHRCQFSPEKPFLDDKLSTILVMMRKLVDILKHTPLAAMGINFGFREESVKFDYLNVFDFADSGKLAENGYFHKNVELIRSFPLDDCILRLIMIHNEPDIVINLNFHYETNIKKIGDILKDDLIIKQKELALKMLHDVYDLDIEEED